MIAEGKGAADVIAAQPFPDYDEKLGVNEASQNFIRVVYCSLKP